MAIHNDTESIGIVEKRRLLAVTMQSKLPAYAEQPETLQLLLRIPLLTKPPAMNHLVTQLPAPASEKNKIYTHMPAAKF